MGTNYQWTKLAYLGAAIAFSGWVRLIERCWPPRTDWRGVLTEDPSKFGSAMLLGYPVPLFWFCLIARSSVKSMGPRRALMNALSSSGLPMVL